jgi:hypothetical protein
MCEGTDVPWAIRRLTKREYDGSLRALFGEGEFFGDDYFGETKFHFFDQTRYTSPLLIERLYEVAVARAESIALAPTDFLPCDPDGNDACVQQIIDHTGSRIYRRPLLGVEVASLKRKPAAASI